VGKPSTLRDVAPNSMFVMKWDFSTLKAEGSSAEFELSLNGYVNDSIQEFATMYHEFLDTEVTIHPDDCIRSLGSLMCGVRFHTQDLPPHR
jgi:hypothetical protein